MKSKLYCYVDESGQETQGRLFIVAVVIVAAEREAARMWLGQIETESGKGRKKWTKATRQQRRAYCERWASLPAWPGVSYAVRFEHTTDYLGATTEAVAQALASRMGDQPYHATVLIDGLGKAERHRVASGLRSRRIYADKIRGLRDESDEFIRLADALAGLTRDYHEGQMDLIPVFDKLVQRGLIRELP